MALEPQDELDALTRKTNELLAILIKQRQLDDEQKVERCRYLLQLKRNSSLEEDCAQDSSELFSEETCELPLSLDHLLGASQKEHLRPSTLAESSVSTASGSSLSDSEFLMESAPSGSRAPRDNSRPARKFEERVSCLADIKRRKANVRVHWWDERSSAGESWWWWF